MSHSGGQSASASGLVRRLRRGGGGGREAVIADNQSCGMENIWLKKLIKMISYLEDNTGDDKSQSHRIILIFLSSLEM